MGAGVGKLAPARARRVAALGAFVVALTACGVGTWQVTSTPTPVRAIHTALLPNGKVLLVAGSGNRVDAFEAGEFETSVWDPVTNSFTAVDTPWDAFCAGHAQLPDGRLLLAGGTTGYDTPTSDRTGSRRTYVFDPATESYERVGDMGNGRWYPTLVTLGDGSILAVAGLNGSGQLTNTSQVFTGTGWTPNARPPTRDDSSSPHWWPLYPGLHLLADGRVFFSGAHTFDGTPAPATWDLTANTMRRVGGLTGIALTDHAMSVLLPPAQDQKVMILGGGSIDGNTTTDRTAIVDLTAATPTWAPAAPLDTRKMYASAVVLPDRTVFETGGSVRSRERAGTNYVYSAQIFDPVSGRWTKAKDHKVARGYHSSALLLPDGRVATFGNDPTSGAFDLRIEIYSPEYLTRGPRPQIAALPGELAYGGTATMTATSSTPIRNVSLVRPMAVTHSVDANQRLVDVPFTVEQDGSFTLSLTDNPNLAPPGWYMLFAVDQMGVPSAASWVHVGPAPEEAPPPPPEDAPPVAGAPSAGA